MKSIPFLITFIVCFPHFIFSQTCGCTDPLATNYNTAAVINDGSCQYANTSISPTSAYQLDAILNGSSGMIYWDNAYWTYNDHDNLNLYAIDSTTGAIIDSIRIATTGNYDTEEISQDADYIYFGDFGNNSGSRTNLHILRIAKEDMHEQNIPIDTIFFTYDDQTDFTPASMNTDYDCESFIVTEDSIYLFTKQWITEATACYVLPKTPGHFAAHKRDTCNVNGLITGATYVPDKQLIVLCGYNTTLSPFIFLLYDFENDNFFAGNKRKITINQIGHQVEAIATSNALQYYITNEYFNYSILTTNPKLQLLDLTSYLSHYLLDTLDGVYNYEYIVPTVFPNPAIDCIHLTSWESCQGYTYQIYNMSGQQIQSGKISSPTIQFQNAQMSKGSYILTIEGAKGKYSFPIFKQ